MKEDGNQVFFLVLKFHPISEDYPVVCSAAGRNLQAERGCAYPYGKAHTLPALAIQSTLRM